MFRTVATVKVTPPTALPRAKHDISEYARLNGTVDFLILHETESSFDVSFKVDATTFTEAEMLVDLFFQGFTALGPGDSTQFERGSDLLVPA